MIANIARIVLLSTTVFLTAKVHNEQVTQKLNAPEDKSLTILFAGDIMQHGPQIQAAWNDSVGMYDYSPCFSYVAPIIQKYDIAIANLEVTLAGKPYTGYPQFSAPDILAAGIKSAGFDVLATANNHSCDRGDEGIIRTINVLDSIGIKRTGTFKDSIDYKGHNPLILEKNGITLALLNYTYGTNGLSFTYPAMVNLIDENKLIDDLKYSRSLSPDFIIVFFHWGIEYQTDPNEEQQHLADICTQNGADAIIGSHPHVIQPFEFHESSDTTLPNKLIVYSLGNFVSNQRDRYKDGGAMVGFTLLKTWNRKTIIKPEYHLTWVYNPVEKEKKQYYILPVNMPASDSLSFNSDSLSLMYKQGPYLPKLNNQDILKMTTFINDSRNHLSSNPLAIPEASYSTVKEE